MQIPRDKRDKDKFAIFLHCPFFFFFLFLINPFNYKFHTFALKVKENDERGSSSCCALVGLSIDPLSISV
jgi:hypothetical protein